MSDSKKNYPLGIAISLFLMVVTFFVYSQILDYGFLNFDDNKYVTENVHVTNGLNGEGVVWAFTEPYASNWHPVTWLSHMLDFEVYGFDPFGHHLTNLIFHVANTLLLFWVLMKMTGALWRSAFVAVIFAVHPLNVESVAWIAERKNVLSAFFFFLTLWAYFDYVDKKRSFLFVILFLALGLMSKPMLVTVPFLMILLDYWPLRRLGFGEALVDSEKPVAKKESLGRLIIEKWSLFVLVTGSCVITYIAQKGGDAVRATEFRSFYSSIANGLVSYIEYIEKMVWPRGLSVFYPHAGDSVSGLKTFVCGLVLLVFTTWVVRGAKRFPYLAVGWFWYLGTLVPVIGIVQVGEQAMADRYTYVPLVGIFICIAWGIPELLKNVNQKLVPVLAGIFIPILMLLAWGQVKHWESSVTLFEHAIDVNENETPSFVIAYNNLGHALLSEKRYEEAVKIFKRAVEVNPNYSKAQNNLGNALSELKRYDQAIAHYQLAIKIEPEYAEAFNNLANALRSSGQIKESVEYYSEAIRIDSEYDEAYFNLGITLSQLGELDNAIIQYQKALEINSRFTRAHNNLASLLAQQKKVSEAISHYRQAIALDPDFAIAHNNLGSTLAGQGKFKESIVHFERALSADPNYVDAQNNLQLAHSLAKP